MLITSGYDFEGYKIVEYLDICSGECALGTGFLSSFGAGIADLLGTNSSMYEAKLNEARRHALNNLMSAASALGANAIIAVDIDYTVFSADIIGVTANGTAVKVEERLDRRDHLQIQLDIKNFNPDLPIKPNSLTIISENGKCYASLSMIDMVKNNISAIACNIHLTTVLEDEYELNNIAFYGFAIDGKERVSKGVPISIPYEKMELLRSAHVTISRYSDSQEIAVPETNDIIWDPESDPIDNQGNKIPFKVRFILDVKTMRAAKEILKYCEECIEKGEAIPAELLDSIKSYALKEIYGSMYDECMKQIEQFMK